MENNAQLGKKCPRCKVTKDKVYFYKSKTRLDKLAVYCKQCEEGYKRKKDDDRKYAHLYGIV